MATAHIRPRGTIVPVHAVLLASSLPLFVGTLLADWAYSSTYEVQWLNFAAWLIVGAMVCLGFALLWAAIELLRSGISRDRTGLGYVLALLATFVLGFVNALVHAKDGWATMPTGLVLSLIVAILAGACVWAGFSTLRPEPAR